VHIVSSFSIARARDAAWTNTQILWSQRKMPLLYEATVAGMAWGHPSLETLALH
jgi:hypothetical protein